MAENTRSPSTVGESDRGKLNADETTQLISSDDKSDTRQPSEAQRLSTAKQLETTTDFEVGVEPTEITPDNRIVRRIIAEDPDYNLATVQELELRVLNKIIENFAFNANMYKDLKVSHKKILLNKISLSIPLKVVADLIEDGRYWQRKCESLWPLCDISHYGQSWKRLFFEKNLEQIIENFIPEKTDRTCLEETLILSVPYVQRLVITQLLPPVRMEQKHAAKQSVEGEEGGDESDVEESPLIDHLSLEPIVSKLINLTELKIAYDVKNIGMNFEWNVFQFTVNDCQMIAKCVASARQLKVFHLNRSRVDCDRCRVIISQILDHPNLLELDFSHNHIGDRGARALGKFLNNRSRLEVLRITNNMIRSAGAQALGYALTKNSTLKVLDIRLNRILDEGGQAICKALLINNTLEQINLAGNEMFEPTAAIVAQVVQNNQTLKWLDLSNNRLGLDGGKQIQEGISQNRTLTHLDLRFTECGDEAVFFISQVISFNRKLKTYEAENDLEIKEASVFIIEDLRKAIFPTHGGETNSISDDRNNENSASKLDDDFPAKRQFMKRAGAEA